MLSYPIQSSLRKRISKRDEITGRNLIYTMSDPQISFPSTKFSMDIKTILSDWQGYKMLIKSFKSVEAERENIIEQDGAFLVN